MTINRIVRSVEGFAAGFLLLQAGGCDLTGFNELLQTVLLGVTAAGSIAIIQNI